MNEEGEDLLTGACGSNIDRLARIEGEYDPDNVFRVNPNIEPARRRS